MKNLEFFNRNQARDFINKNKPMAIIPTGSVEQHLNHLFIGMDINSATRIVSLMIEETDLKCSFVEGHLIFRI